MIKQFYSDLITRLTAEVRDEQGALLFKHSALWNNQPDNEKTEKPHRYPALFIEFSDIVYRSENYGVQKIDLGFNVHCVFSQLVEDLDLLDLVSSVGVALHGYKLDYCSNIVRTAEIQDIDRDRLTDWVIGFRTVITVDTTAIQRRLTPTGAPIALDLTSSLDIDDDTIRTGDGEL